MPDACLVVIAVLLSMLSHMLFAHKEHRFVFPAVPFVIMLVGLGLAELLAWLQELIRCRWFAAATAGVKRRGAIRWQTRSLGLFCNS